MANTWDPQHAVGRDLAARLIAGQFPHVPLGSLERLGEGWDNDVWRAGALVFRFPRRNVAVALLETEGRALPLLSGALPVRIPEPACYGRPTPEFPYPFLGYQYLPGLSGDSLALKPDERAALAAPLGRFLRALHAVDRDRLAGAGVPDDRFRSDVPRYVKLLEERLRTLEARLPADAVAAMRELGGLAEAMPRSDRRTVVHGDLYLRHLLFDDARRWTAVIDWGDLSVGEPLADLTVAYTGLPEEARPAFFEAYGSVDLGDAVRARFIGLVRHGLSLLAYALDTRDAPLEAEARRAIAHVVGPELYSPA